MSLVSDGGPSVRIGDDGEASTSEADSSLASLRLAERADLRGSWAPVDLPVALMEAFEPTLFALPAALGLAFGLDDPVAVSRRLAGAPEFDSSERLFEATAAVLARLA